MFKVGDKVRCIEGYRDVLKLGATEIVELVGPVDSPALLGGHLKLKDKPGAWLFRRFELVHSATDSTEYEDVIAAQKIMEEIEGLT
jgi:hypothetical protein